MKINSHLRDQHGYSLSESVKWAPAAMLEIHEAEHAETACNHWHDRTTGEQMFGKIPGEIDEPGSALTLPAPDTRNGA